MILFVQWTYQPKAIDARGTMTRKAKNTQSPFCDTVTEAVFRRPHRLLIGFSSPSALMRRCDSNLKDSGLPDHVLIQDAKFRIKDYLEGVTLGDNETKISPSTLLEQLLDQAPDPSGSVYVVEAILDATKEGTEQEESQKLKDVANSWLTHLIYPGS